MKITLVISSMGAGGAERVMSILANGLVERGHAVSLLTWDDPGASSFYELDPAVIHQGLGLLKDSSTLFEALGSNWKRLKTLRRAILHTGPDVVLSFMDRCNVVTLMALMGTPIPVVVSERIDPNTWNPGKVWRALRRLVYGRAKALVVQSAGARSYFSRRVRARTRIIPNPVVPVPLRACLDQWNGHPAVVAMGRLVPQKGFGVLLNALARVLPRHPEWRAIILGEGPDRELLERLASQLGILAQVEFKGVVKDPTHHLLSSHLFVLSSWVEGFPNALCEAMASGLPVIATTCTDSIPMILDEGRAGVMVPPGDVEALASAMARLMGDQDLRRSLGSAATSITTRYSVSNILDLWEGLLNSASTGTHLLAY